MPDSIPLRLVVFDVDGTLVDSQHNIHAAMAAAFSAHGLTAPEPAAVRRVIGLPLEEAVARLRPAEAEVAGARLTASYRQAFADLRGGADFDEPLFPGARQALDSLEAAGLLLGLATGKSRRGVDSTLAHHGLEGRFVTIRTGDSGPGKPHPAMLRAALDESGIARPADAVMLGDTSYDIRMARTVGTGALGVAWGYHAPGELTGHGAHAILEDYAALAETVAGLWAHLQEEN